MLEITYNTAFSAVPTVIFLHLARMVSKRHGLIQCIISFCRGGNKGSEASLDAEFRSPLSNKVQICLYILKYEDPFNVLALTFAPYNGRRRFGNSIELPGSRI